MRTVSVEAIVEALVAEGALRPEEIADFVERITTLDIGTDIFEEQDEGDYWW
ncbi:hypothetical protein [Thermus phage P23-45]|uniref:Uncharacterized protein n=2 Tax=Oshimavirus TaxID=1623293 RepID=A7XXA7_BP234|nr:hypothetical protein P23p76 [Thermus phage P23-45]YP_001468045.1 hypothetical protein P74p75 [Thermus phage P74-26]ABU96909.1 hypothetical protein P23p76 [Thermus phage P23-45]ABU97025.1 hypothetical protein P74p75 [Thermus phage P74-26]UYB98400.1 hypothetical protein [Thermus phage P23-45]